MPEKKYEIDLLLMNPEYDLIPYIKRKINILNAFEYVMNTEHTYSDIKQNGGIFKNFGHLLRYILFRVFVKCRKKSWIFFKKVKKEYDFAVSYSQNGLGPYYVIDKINAKKKILWYHNGRYEAGEKRYKLDTKYYNLYDQIVAVSNDCRKMLQEHFSFDDKKICVIRNICDVNEIKEKANGFYPETYSKKTFNIATVGRLTKEKGADLAIEVCKILKDAGLSFCWHWIGDGNKKENITEKIEQNGLKDFFKLEGNQINPYPFIKNADLYVQPSYYEAYSTTVTEARILCRPIVVTNVGGMEDQIKDGITGVIAEINQKEIAEKIKEIMCSDNFRQSLISALEKESVNFQNIFADYEKAVFI